MFSFEVQVLHEGLSSAPSLYQFLVFVIRFEDEADQSVEGYLQYGSTLVTVTAQHERFHQCDIF